MKSNNFLELLQTGFRASLGATTSLVETLQNPQKREETLSEISQKVTEWAEKGEITEQEARSFIEEMLRQTKRSGSSPTAETPSETYAAPPTTSATPQTQRSIEELTAQISAVRTELEKLRDSGSNS